MLNKENNAQVTKQIITVLDAILKQKYFEFQNNLYQPEKGVAMGSPISGIMAEIFLQHIEDKHIKHLLDTKNIIYYTRYVDDILIIYDTRHINDNTIQNYIKQIHSNILLNPTHESNGQINYPDLTIIRDNTKLEIDICRKHTTTNTTINYESSHPTEHKTAAYRQYIKRMQTLPLTTERRKTEWMTIKTIAKINNFPDYVITQLQSQIQQKTHKIGNNETDTKTNKKLAVFTYYNPTIRKVTNLFKHTVVGIAFRNTNTLYQLTKPKPHTQTQEHNKSGVYALICNTCKQAYIGQTSRNLKQRYQEHIRYTRNSDPQSAYALHILKNQHEYGFMNDTMTLLKHEQKTPMLIPYEQFFIQTYHRHGLLIQEQHMGDTNPLFQLITHTNTTNTHKH